MRLHGAPPWGSSSSSSSSSSLVRECSEVELWPQLIERQLRDLTLQPDRRVRERPGTPDTSSSYRASLRATQKHTHTHTHFSLDAIL